MLSPICAWLAVRGLVVIADPWDVTPAVVLGLAVLFWVLIAIMSLINLNIKNWPEAGAGDKK